MRLLAPFGFYGAGNVGDEATLHGFARLVGFRTPKPSAWVGSCNPVHNARVEPSFRYYGVARDSLRRRWADYRAEAIVFPGGTPIMDGLGDWPLSEVIPIVAGAVERGRPVAFVGIGTETLQRDASSSLVATHLAPHVSHWSVRSRFDRDRLTTWGVPSERVTVAADMAWLIAPASDVFGRTTLGRLGLGDGPIIGINVNNEQVILEREPAFFESIAEFADGLVDAHHATILFFCSEVRPGPEYDQAAAGRVMAAMRRRDRAVMLPSHYWSPRELMSIIACCQLVMSTRYHVCLFSALQQVPFIALQRSDKVRDLCADVGWPYGLPLGQIRSAALFEQYSAIGRDATAADRLREAAALKAQDSLKNQAALDALIRK